MVCTASDLSAWKDFPKGLRVLLLDQDSTSAAQIKSQLESMDYIVFTFCDEKEALSAISKKPESFHVAMVEVSTNNCIECFKFLENARDLPTIMISNAHCLSTMMKCIALGAVEFLRKPLSEDKLRNIWQHVVHKAFNAGGTVLSDSLKPVKDSVISMLQIKVETKQIKEENLEETQNFRSTHVNELELSPASDKYPAPSTPQLNQGGRLVDDADCQENTNCSTEKDCGELEGKSKSVETTSGMDDATLVESFPESTERVLVEKEDGFTVDVNGQNNVCSMSANVLSPCSRSKNHLKNSNDVAEIPDKSSTPQHSCGSKARKKMKVDWTPDLHKKFVQAVEQLGVDQAIPSRILELMKVEGLTRHNVASHLQKYRMHRRHILPKEDEWRTAAERGQVHSSYYPHKPILAYPPYHSNQCVPPSPVYPMWGATCGQPAGVHTWAPPGYPAWSLADSWHWKPYAGVHADAWGCPIMPLPHHPSPPNSGRIHSPVLVDNTCIVPQKSMDQQPAEEIIDKVVKEAISKPWLPLPLGLKPPSTDSVLAELSRQGIATVPPPTNSFRHVSA